MSRVAPYAAVLLLATGCLRPGRSAHRPERPTCPGVEIALDPVRGDVNTTYLHARVTGSGPNGHLLFSLRTDPRTLAPAGPLVTVVNDVAEADLGAAALVNADTRRGVAVARTVEAEYSDQGCDTFASATFAPSVRAVSPPPSGVMSRGDAARALQEIADVLRRTSGPARLADGTSACRRLYAVVAEVERHREWLSAPDSSYGHLRKGRDTCLDMPLAAALQVEDQVV